ncbi:class I SAM-dependent methyltransferase [Streptomyces sp. 549]|uniref:class I SAM-dependent methyltransferase n=1 Tax=Streptomyces sp. 549 TaxID=3049076 RepID=UPI0024C45A55|nr:class I SAM-dependent methyltransferase [Streptomyces sp. 549]MDK1474488.1 class I SAM-dependent methyltransferase [Streptomyces sp. 549]
MPDDTAARPAQRTTARNDTSAAELLAAHPWVARVRAAQDGGLLVTPAASATAAAPVPGPLVREHLDQWAEVYEFVYETGEGRRSDDLDLSGWRASDTGRPLPEEHMRDWVDRTVELVLAQQPRRVMELGCGTGLLAHRLHPALDGYVGTDVAQVAVDRLAAAELPHTAFVRAAAHEAGSPQVRQAAHRVFGDGVRPDCVLLNSVTQCFPDLAYLTAVLHGAIAAVEDGGTVIVGDNRHSALLEEHFGALERLRDPEAGAADLASRTAAAVAADEELSFAPAAVARAAAAQSRPVRMGVHARTMADASELTRYRYDLVLHVGPGAEEATASAVHRETWQAHRDRGLHAALRVALARRPAVLSGIPNALLTDAPGGLTPHALRKALTGTDSAVLLDAADPRMLAVAAPPGAGAVPVEEVAEPLSGPAAHEPLPAFVSRRLPEVLRDHLRRAAPGTVPPRITVTPGDAA